MLRALQMKAEAQGATLETMLRPLFEPNGEQAATIPQMTSDERADDFTAWVKTHAVKGVMADDSRESIYSRENEAR